MTDFRPLRSSSRDELALALLKSTELDGPRPNALAKTAAALGISAATLALSASAGAGLAAGGSAAASGATASLVVVGKFLLVGAATGLAVSVGANHAFRSRSAPPNPTVAAVASSTPTMDQSLRRGTPEVEAIESERRAAAVPRPSTSSPNAGPDQPASGESVEPNHGAPVAAFEPTIDYPPAPASAGMSSAQATELAEQVALLDRARAALARGQPREALQELDRYERQWPAGLLAAEALVVRAAALVKIGDRATATRLARPLIEAQPGGKHAAQLRALLAESHRHPSAMELPKE